MKIKRCFSKEQSTVSLGSFNEKETTGRKNGS